MNKEFIKELIDKPNSGYGKVFAISIQLLIVIAIITFSVETIPDLAPGTRQLLKIVEIVCVIVFSVEYLLRLYVSEKKLRFVFSFFGLVDLFAILPFYLSFGVDLRALRALRFLRLFSILKMVRYNRAIKHFSRSVMYAKEEIQLFIFVTLILIYLSAVGIYYFENAAQPEVFSSIFDSLWWAVITLTTVGYGDVYPITVGGKMFTFVILLIGLGIVAIPTGIISSALTKSIDEKKQNY
tara:strand:- start:294050 stop:294766 length:717 start_codon:yes stop_codon:yes gene_type:complete